jgi:hypothetical protein
VSQVTLARNKKLGRSDCRFLSDRRDGERPRRAGTARRLTAALHFPDTPAEARMRRWPAVAYDVFARFFLSHVMAPK